MKPRMHTCDIVESLRDPHPARKNRDIGNEAYIPHEPISMAPRVVPKHHQFSLVGDQAQNCVQCSALAGAVRTNESHDASLLNFQVDAVKRDRSAKSLAQSMCFDDCHGLRLSF